MANVIVLANFLDTGDQAIDIKLFVIEVDGRKFLQYDTQEHKGRILFPLPPGSQAMLTLESKDGKELLLRIRPTSQEVKPDVVTGPVA